MPFTAGIENIKCAKVDSTESKNGLPIPGSIPRTAHSTVPPIESNSSLASSISFLIASSFNSSINGNSFDIYELIKPSVIFSSKKLLSSIVPIDFIWDTILIPFASNICLHIAPAKTIGAVILPEKWPPPR